MAATRAAVDEVLSVSAGHMDGTNWTQWVRETKGDVKLRGCACGGFRAELGWEKEEGI